MRTSRTFVLIAALTSASCGGGGSGGSPPSSPPPAAPLAVVISSSSLDVFGQDDSAATLTVDFQQTGTAPGPVAPDLTYDASMLTLQGALVADAGHYRLTFKSRSGLAPGEHLGSFRFRLCQESACSTVYPSTTHTLNYKITVVMGSWATFQRNPAHTGYVPMTVDTTKLTPAWGVYSDDLVGFTRVAADAERAYFGVWGYQGVTRFSGMAAVDLRTGMPVYTQLLEVGTDEVGDPAVAGDRVFIPYRKSGSCCNNPISIRRGSDGQSLGAATFVSQSGAYFAPTPFGDDLISTSGQYGNVVYNHRQADGSLKWEGAGSGYFAWNLEATAVDADNVYHYTGESLDVFRRSDGVRIRSIIDPYQVRTAYDYWGAPMILPDGSVVTYSGTVSAERADVRHGYQRPLVRYRPAAGDIAWKTADSYRNIPATRGNLIFAARNNPMQLDAINVSDGSIAWSWVPPDGTGFRANIVVTDNVLFLSTSKHVYGITLSDRSLVFTHDTPGDIAVSPNSLLLISELQEYSNADALTPLRGAPRLRAFRLR